ncbi:hypothetical protein N9Y92_02640 [Chlamydiales bacterium]|nr:hypothetical protein [Chlamydiales bacterium]
MTAAGKVYSDFASSSNIIFKDVESVQYLHRFMLGSLQIIEALGGSLSPIKVPRLKEMINLTESVINASSFFTASRYFFTPIKAHHVGVNFQRVDEDNHLVQQGGTVVRVISEDQQRRIGRTSFEHDYLEKPVDAVASVSFLWASFVSVVELLESFKIPVLANIEKGMGFIPLFGSAIGSLIVSSFIQTATAAVIVGTGGLVVDSVHRLIDAETDVRYDKKGEMLLLAARVANFLFYVSLHFKAAPLMLGLASASAGSLGMASLIYQGFGEAAIKGQREDIFNQARTQIQA